MNTTSHAQRIKQELITAGMSSYGLGKMGSRYLPNIIHKDEHIGGVVYGRYSNGSGMLIATDKRVIFLDKKPLFSSNEEVTYDVVSGLKVNKTGLVRSLTLHTKVKDFTLRYVNQACANKFRDYIENRHLEGRNPVGSTKSDQSAALTKEAAEFLVKQAVGVLSTADKNGTVHGAVVYFVLDQQHKIHVLTKADTTKARNVIAHKQVALTIFNASEAKTLQIQGSAQIETDEKIKQHIFNQVMKPHKYKSGYRLPPVVWLEAGMFVIITIEVQSANYSDFSKKGE